MTPVLDAANTEARPEAIANDNESRAPVAIEFAGWMPVFARFGHCGGHPQFNHVGEPPAGYHFVTEHSIVTPFVDPIDPDEPVPFGLRCRRFAEALPGWIGKCLSLPIRPIYTVLECAITYGPVRCLLTVFAAIRLFFALLRGGGRLLPVFAFVRSRHFTSQVQLPAHPNLLFLTSVPYTYGHHPWVIEIEDVTTLFFPFIQNGKTADLRLEDSPYFPILKTLLEAENCRGIITHIRSTAEALPRMFQSEIIARKVSYAPMGVALPSAYQAHEADETIHFLFTSSWHQNPGSLFLRGGLEVLEAFEILQERYPQVRLTLRTGLPNLDARYRRIIEKCWVRVIDRYLPNEDMDDLMRSTHVFVLPAARIHIVSLLKAMAYGQVVVTSDGWGFSEYLDDGRNGMIVPGRLNKSSWTDPQTGMLREDYEPMETADPAIVESLVAALSTLVEDRTLRRRLGAQARHDIATRFSLKNWNKGLKDVLDRALASK